MFFLRFGYFALLFLLIFFAFPLLIRSSLRSRFLFVDFLSHFNKVFVSLRSLFEERKKKNGKRNKKTSPERLALIDIRAHARSLNNYQAEPSILR